MKSTKTNTTSAAAFENVDVQTVEDFKNAGLIVSVVINLFLFSAWLVLATTHVFNGQIIAILQK